jgi:hypothetical protein
MKGLKNISFKKTFHEILHIKKNNHNEQSYSWILKICLKIKMFVSYDK